MVYILTSLNLLSNLLTKPEARGFREEKKLTNLGTRQ